MSVTPDQQAMWDAMTALGQDTDGDTDPGAMIAGMGQDGFRKAFLDFVSDARRDHETAIDEVCMDPSAHQPMNIPEPEGGPADGHTFEFTMRSRGAYSVTGGAYSDSQWMSEPLWGVRVRAWSLNAALVKALGLPMRAWNEYLPAYQEEKE